MTLLRQEQGTPQMEESAFLQLELSGVAPQSGLVLLLPACTSIPLSLLICARSVLETGHEHQAIARWVIAAGGT